MASLTVGSLVGPGPPAHPSAGRITRHGICLSADLALPAVWLRWVTMMTEGLRRWWLRLAQLAALAMMALVGLFDLRVGLVQGMGLPALALFVVRVGLAVATALVCLPIHRQGSRRLPQAAILLAAASLTVTAGMRLIDLDGMGGGSWGLAEALGLLGVIFVVARRAAPRWAPAAVGITGLAVAVLPLRVGTTDGLVIIGLIQALGGAGAAAAGTYLRLLAAGRERAVAAVRAEQRAEFARDLHDFIAHHVTGIVVQAQGARIVAEQDPQRVLVALEQIERAGAETMASMRRMVGVLRNPDADPDAPLAPVAGAADLWSLVAGFNSGATATHARLHVDGELEGLPVEVSTSAYRVVMEALTNARQHAPDARVVDVLVRRTPDWLLVRVTDDGATPRTPPARGHGYGLIGLAERVRAVGGTISAGPAIGGGWRVDAALPLNREVAW